MTVKILEENIPDAAKARRAHELVISVDSKPSAPRKDPIQSNGTSKSKSTSMSALETADKEQETKEPKEPKLPRFEEFRVMTDEQWDALGIELTEKVYAQMFNEYCKRNNLDLDTEFPKMMTELRGKSDSGSE